MHEKALREHELSHMRQSLTHEKRAKSAGVAQLHHEMRAAKNHLTELDARIAQLVRRSTEGLNQRWGPLMRCGNDKSHLARQIERYADIYMSRVSNLIDYTPFAYLRAPRVNLPHEVDWER